MSLKTDYIAITSTEMESNLQWGHGTRLQEFRPVLHSS